MIAYWIYAAGVVLLVILLLLCAPAKLEDDDEKRTEPHSRKFYCYTPTLFVRLTQCGHLDHLVCFFFLRVLDLRILWSRGLHQKSG